MKSSTRIAVNSIATYARLVVTAIVGFIAVPIALKKLGPSDYGIYSVLGGSLAFFLFINGALTAGAERHFAHALGREDETELNAWYSASLVIHLLWAAVMAIIALSLEGWILHHLLTLPEARLGAAAWVYRTVLFTFVVGVASTPFQAMLMAHEEIAVQSCISIVGAGAFLAGIFALPYLTGDSLVIYALVYASNQIILSVGSILFAMVAHGVCRRISPAGIKAERVRELIGFSFWNLFGAFAGTVRNQGPALLMNNFFGPVINASYGIALQVNGAFTNLSSAVYRATIPQIIKNYAAGNKERMGTLACLCSKYSFLILWIAVSPILFNLNFVIHVWLHREPKLVVAFIILMSTTLLVDQLTNGCIAVAQAVGDISGFQITTSLLMCIGIPIGWMLVANGFSVIAILGAGMFAAVATGAAQLYFGRRLGNVYFSKWSRLTCMPSLLTALITGCVLVGIQNKLHEGAARILISYLTTMFFSAIVLWFFASTEAERSHITALSVSMWKRIVRSRV